MRYGRITECNLISIIHFITSSSQVKTMACFNWQVLFITMKLGSGCTWMDGVCGARYQTPSVLQSERLDYWANHWYDWHQFLPFILNKDVPSYHPSYPSRMATWVSMTENSDERTTLTDFNFRKQEFIITNLLERWYNSTFHQKYIRTQMGNKRVKKVEKLLQQQSF